MIKVEIRLIDSEAQLLLYPENEDDYQALSLLLNGKKVIDIKRPVRDSVNQDFAILTLSREPGLRATPEAGTG